MLAVLLPVLGLATLPLVPDDALPDEVFAVLLPVPAEPVEALPEDAVLSLSASADSVLSAAASSLSAVSYLSFSSSGFTVSTA